MIHLETQKSLGKEFEFFRKINSYFQEHDNSVLVSGKPLFSQVKHGVFFPSNLFALYYAFGRLDLHKFGHFLDLGSGDGRVVFLASLFTRASGIESDEELHKRSLLHSDSLGIKAMLINRNFLEHSLSGYDIFFINYGSDLSEGLASKLKQEAKGKKLIVYNSTDDAEKHLKKIKTITFEDVPVSLFLIE